MANHLDRDVGSPVTFIVSVGAIQILGILAMILTGIWMGKYLGGFAWDGSGLEFNYHPLCMVISMVFLYSEGKIIVSSRFSVARLIRRTFLEPNRVRAYHELMNRRYADVRIN